MDRGIIKSQARQIIKGKIFPLFVISLVCIALTGGLNSFITYSSQIANNSKNYDSFDEYAEHYASGDWLFDEDNNADDYYDDYYDYDDNGNDNSSDFKNFGGNSGTSDFENYNGAVSLNLSILNGVANLLSFISIFLVTLTIALEGYYVLVVRGRRVELGSDLGHLFKTSFNENYGKKLWLYYLRAIIITLMTFLLIIPGIIKNYEYYFSSRNNSAKVNTR